MLVLRVQVRQRRNEAAWLFCKNNVIFPKHNFIFQCRLASSVFSISCTHFYQPINKWKRTPTRGFLAASFFLLSLSSLSFLLMLARYEFVAVDFRDDFLTVRHRRICVSSCWELLLNDVSDGTILILVHQISSHPIQPSAIGSHLKQSLKTSELVKCSHTQGVLQIVQSKQESTKTKRITHLEDLSFHQVSWKISSPWILHHSSFFHHF